MSFQHSQKLSEGAVYVEHVNEPLLDPRQSRASAAAGFNSMSNIHTGLSDDEAAKRLSYFGRNCLEEKEVNLLLKFLGYFWGPMVRMKTKKY